MTETVTWGERLFWDWIFFLGNWKGELNPEWTFLFCYRTVRHAFTIRWPWNQVNWRKGEMIGRAPHFLRCPVHLWQPLKIEGKESFSCPIVLITAAGPPGEESLVVRKMSVREVGKLDPYPREKDWLLGLSWQGLPSSHSSCVLFERSSVVIKGGNIFGDGVGKFGLSVWYGLVDWGKTWVWFCIRV